jgi:hypothetical protein
MLNASLYLGHVVASRFGLTFLNFWKTHKWQMCLWSDVIQTSLAKRVILYLFCVWKPFKVQDATYHVILVWFLPSIGVATGTVTGSWSVPLDLGIHMFLPREDSSKDMYGHFTCKILTHLKTTLSTRLRKKLTKIPEPATWLYPLMRRYTLAQN